MSFKDKSIICADCGATFAVSAEKQEFFQSWGLINETRYCPSCRQSRKAKLYTIGSHGSSTLRRLFRATCADCGKNTEVPFEPRAGRRVYCSDCYRKVKASQR